MFNLNKSLYTFTDEKRISLKPFGRQRHGRMRVKAQLTHLKGNSAAYFSITADVFSSNGKMIAGGCMHDEILKHWPHLKDFVAMHLSSENGQPMYAVENGWYWNGGTKWQEYSRKTLAKHLRITEEEADAIHEECKTKEEFKERVEAMFPRMKEEADSLIAKYGLRVIEE